MAVSRAYIQRQAQVIAGLSQSAKGVLTRRLKDVDDWDQAAAILSETCKAYTDMSAAITAQYYAGIRSASKVKSKYQAQAVSGYDADAVYSAAISIMEEVQAGKATVPAVELLANVANREIKNASDSCIRENVKRDPAKPKYAIVPNGDACAFCQMRASLGYTYGDEDAAHSHDHCTCMATPVFGDEDIEGYNPKEYEDRYEDAKEALEKGEISEDLKKRIESAEEQHNKRYKADETAKPWDKSNAILMVMREQQGIS